MQSEVGHNARFLLNFKSSLKERKEEEEEKIRSDTNKKILSHTKVVVSLVRLLAKPDSPEPFVP
jgi:hypothetical protein